MQRTPAACGSLRAPGAVTAQPRPRNDTAPQSKRGRLRSARKRLKNKSLLLGEAGAWDAAVAASQEPAGHGSPRPINPAAALDAHDPKRARARAAFGLNDLVPEFFSPCLICVPIRSS